jgi:DMSO/TMAO reductase YedYZ molybdopterin-dependent catalytic subunit
VTATVPAILFASCVSLVNGWPSPLEPVAEFLMQWTPVPVAEALLSRLNETARPAALLGALAIVMLIGGVAGGVQAAAGCGLAREVGGYLAGSALLATALFVLFPATNDMPYLVFLLLFVLCLGLVRARRRVAGRREFIERTGVVLAGAAALVLLFGLEPVFSRLQPRRLFGFRSPRGLAISGLTPLVTDISDFYVMDKVLQPPVLDATGWRLRIDGLVDRPQELTFAALTALPRVSTFITCECIDNPVGGSLVGTALWTGVHVEDVLRAAGPRGNTAVFHAADSYGESVAIGELREAGALIAYGMNGETLPRAHGYPTRLILPGVYGFKSVKWLTGIEVINGPRAGAWHQHGWTEDGRIHTTTRIDLARRNGDRIVVAGVAIAGRRGVRAVELRVNGGPWVPARLGPVLGKKAWVQWTASLTGGGPARIEARAIDGSGTIQRARRHGSFPDGATGWAAFDL